MIPLSTPITTCGGQVLHAVPIKKGQQVLIGISAFNSSEAIFGKTAREFRPERWQEQSLLDSVPQHKSYAAYSPQLNFLGGPRYDMPSLQSRLADETCICAEAALAFASPAWK